MNRQAFYTMKFLSVLLVLLMTVLLGCEDGLFTLTIQFEGVGKLSAKSRVYYDQTQIGEVQRVESTEEGGFQVAVLINPAHKATMTTNAKFAIDNDPFDRAREALIVTQQPPGGMALKNGSVVQGEKRQDRFEQWLSDLQKKTDEATQQLQQSMQDLKDSLSQQSHEFGASLEKSLDGLNQSLRDYGKSLESPLTDEDIQAMQKSLDGFIAQFKSLSEEMQAKIRNEVIPKLRQNLEALRERLKQQGREGDAEKIDRQIDQIQTI